MQRACLSSSAGGAISQVPPSRCLLRWHFTTARPAPWVRFLKLRYANWFSLPLLPTSSSPLPLLPYPLLPPIRLFPFCSPSLIFTSPSLFLVLFFMPHRSSSLSPPSLPYPPSLPSPSAYPLSFSLPTPSFPSSPLKSLPPPMSFPHPSYKESVFTGSEGLT